MQTIYYEDASPTIPRPTSIFLAGPTLRIAGRTPWRAEALAWLEGKGFMGTVVVPEFRDIDALMKADKNPFGDRFGTPPSPVPGMKASSYNILKWETEGIENVTVVLFWMPFQTREQKPTGAGYMPGFTTRAEVTREMNRSPGRIVMGMPDGALSSSHIRYHAHYAGLTVLSTLNDTLQAAYDRATAPAKTCLKCLQPYQTGGAVLCDLCADSNRL